MIPTVHVIAHTKLIGIPAELSSPNIAEKKQDQGTDLARLIECAGRACYDSYGTGRPSADYHKHILEVAHGSVLEHASISFYLDNISRGCTHELVRHRAGCAISQRSTRYVDEHESPWILHPLITQFIDDKGNGDLCESVKHDTDVVQDVAKANYEAIVDVLQDYMIGKGIDKFTARKQARGAARGLLGNALCTSMVWTANIRALRHVISMRASRHADAEIRVLANRLYEESILVCPEYFADFVRADCPDGIGYELTTPYAKV